MRCAQCLNMHHENIITEQLLILILYIIVQGLPVRIAEDSFYIQNPRRFSNSDSHDYKIHSHSKQNTFPRYTAMILGIRIGDRNLGYKNRF
jgi:hypothetical protein